MRSFTTGSTGAGTTAEAHSSASVFVSPYFLMAQWAPYRSPIRAFADQCARFPLPPYGMSVYIPVFTSADKASEQTEASPNVAETVPATGIEGATVKTMTASSCSRRCGVTA
jgi:hypothetical protein